jgi:hypothetical protein
MHRYITFALPFVDGNNLIQRPAKALKLIGGLKYVVANVKRAEDASVVLGNRTESRWRPLLLDQ